MTELQQPPLATLYWAHSPGAHDGAPVAQMLLERYRRARARWRTGEGVSLTSTADLRALLGAGADRGDELLLAILEAVETLEQGTGPTASLALDAAYAGWVEYAAIVYGRGDVQAATYLAIEVAGDAEESGHFVLATRALIYAAFLTMREARIEESEEMCRRALALARSARSTAMIHRAQIGSANLVRMRGNLPTAEAMLDRLIRSARRNAPSVLAIALLMRSNVAWARGQHGEAVVIATRALLAAPDERIRVRVLIELASLFTEFADTGLGIVSRQILEYAVVHSPEHATRQHAAIGLLSLAVDQRRANDFAKWRAALQDARLAPRQAIHFAMDVARGIQAFALPEDPVPHLDEAERIATQRGLSRYRFVIAEKREALARTTASGATDDASDQVPIAVPRGVRVAARRVVAELVTVGGAGAA